MANEPPIDSRPNPGSDAARDRGCICAVMDNNHGRSAPWPPDGWWITKGCPIHAPPSDAIEPPFVSEGPCGEDGACAHVPGCRCPFTRPPDWMREVEPDRWDISDRD